MRRFLFSAMLLAWAGFLSAQVTVDSIVDPETFPVPTSVSDANVRLLSKYSTTWYMVKPSQLRLDVDASWGVIAADSTGNLTWLGTAKPSSDGEFIAITDFEGDRIFLPTLAKADSSLVTLSISNDTLFYTNHGGTVAFEVLPAASGGTGQTNEGSNIGGSSEVFKAMSDSTLVFRTLDVSGPRITITQTDSTLVFEVPEDDNQTIDSLALNGSILTISLEDDGEAPITLDLASLTGAGTDNQTVDTLSYSGGVITLALRDDGEAPYTVDISGVDTDTQLSEEQVEDIVGAMFSGNTETLITITYQDGDGTIDAVVSVGLDDLDDTNITSPADSTLLFWDDANSEWIDGVTIEELRGGGVGTDDQTLAEVLAEGAIAGTAIDMDGNNINNVNQLTIDATSNDFVLNGNGTTLEVTVGGSEVFSISAAGVVTINDAYTLPTTAGADGLVIKSDGLGGSDWESDNTGGLGGGETNEGENLGGGSEIFKSKSDTTFQFRTLTEGDGVTLTQANDTINIRASIPRRYSYDDLRTSPPTDSIVLITEPGYTGLFIRVSTGTEDSGVTIKDNNNDYWDRIRDPGYYNVNWYKLGGPCENSQINNILVTYSDVLNMIMDNSGGNCTVDFSNGNEASIYTFDTRVDLQENVRFIGQGDTLRRNDAIWTTVTSAGTTGESSITVADTTGFRKGQRISVSTYRSQNGILVSKKLIGSTAANTINLSGTIESDIAVGDTVFTCFPMFNNTDGLELGDVVFDGLVFDGNWRNNPYTNSWNQAPTINILNNFGSHTTINNCKFYDTPCENVITAASTVTNCEASNLAGSFFHLSGVVDTAFQVLIENCWVYDVCMVGDDTTGHSEAAIVSSGSPLSIRMNNCYFFNGSEAVFGDLGGDTDWWNIQGIRAENFRYVTWGVTNNAKIEGFRLRDSYFLNCNRFEGTGGSALDGEGFVDAVIDNNTFINTAVRIEGSRNMKFTNNKLLYEPSEGGFTNYIEDGLPYLDAMAYFSDFAHLDFSGNILRSDTTTMTDTLVYGVIFDCTDMTDNGVSSEYFLSYGLNCTNNEILHFQRGITCDTAVVDPFASDNRRNRAWHDWNINNNKVQMLQQSNANSWGILIGPGMEANYNTIYTSRDTTLTTIWPIFAYGIDDILNIDDNLPGATIMHNQIIGPWDFAQSIHSIFIGGDTSTNEAGFNCIVEYNLTPTPISGGGAIQSPAISRILYNRLISDELPGMTAPVFAPPLNYEY
jgi:hypothetical protein